MAAYFIFSVDYGKIRTNVCYYYYCSCCYEGFVRISPVLSLCCNDASVCRNSAAKLVMSALQMDAVVVVVVVVKNLLGFHQFFRSVVKMLQPEAQTCRHLFGGRAFVAE